MTSTHSAAETRQGVLFALAAYGSWGLFPAFWKLMSDIPPPEVLAYRVSIPASSWTPCRSP